MNASPKKEKAGNVMPAAAKKLSVSPHTISVVDRFLDMERRKFFKKIRHMLEIVFQFALRDQFDARIEQFAEFVDLTKKENLANE